MILPDVNVVIYAHRQDAPIIRHFRAWLEDVVSADESFAMSELVLSGFVRIVTNPRIFRPPSSAEAAFTFCEQLLAQPGCVPVRPGPRHWGIFARLCRESGARGPLVPDAYFAALAIEAGCEWITTDRDFARFKGLRWRHPLT